MHTGSWGKFHYSPGHSLAIPGASCRVHDHPADWVTVPTTQAPHHPLTSQGSPAAHRWRHLALFSPSYTFLQGLEDTSNEALNALLCWVVKMVLGRLGRLWSLPSSDVPFPAPWADLQRLSSSSLFPKKKQRSVSPVPDVPHGAVCCSEISSGMPQSQDGFRYECENLCGADLKASRKRLRKHF